MDCETKVIFTKDPSYIINAHSWPEDAGKRPENAHEQPNVQGNQNPQNPQNQQPQQNGINVQINNIPSVNFPIASKQPAQPDTQEAAEEPSSNKQKLNKKERQNFLIKEMRRRINHYFEINVRQVGDMIPKLITNFLINDILVG